MLTVLTYWVIAVVVVLGGWYLFMRSKKHRCDACGHHRDRHGETTGRGCAGCTCVTYGRWADESSY